MIDSAASGGAISFTHSNVDNVAGGGGSTYNCTGRYLNKNFDLHLAEIDMETFTKEDIEKLNSFNTLMDNSNDTLR